MIKREDLLAKGYTAEQTTELLDLFHNDQNSAIAELRTQIATLTTERDSARGEAQKYKKGGELYQDPAEFERLKTFEQETLTKATNAKKTDALTKLFKGANASETATKLLIRGTDLSKIELDDKGEIKGGADILKQAKADFSDVFGEVGGGGTGAPHAGNNGGGASKGFNFNFTGVRAKPETKN